MYNFANRIFTLFILVVVFSSFLVGQVTGVVTDIDGEIIPFVTIYKQGTSVGTVSNGNGEYSLDLPDGKHVIIYKFVGYKEESIELEIRGPIVKNVILQEEAYQLDEIVVSADGEDPAYRVIRNTIDARERNKGKTEKFDVNLYVKGVVKMLKVPEKIFGAEIGDMDGMIDTTGQGIVYLAESQSKVYFHHPNLEKEEMYSSIVAEDNSSMNFNRFFGQSFNVYDEYFQINRSLISPIADNALTYYKYKMIEAKLDDHGRLINRIQVIPKTNERPVFFGEVYIIEDTWIVKEFSLSFTGDAVNERFIDTINIKQIHLPIEDDKWMLFTQTLEFKGGLFGFEAGGGFTSVFSDYNLNPDFDESFFGNEEFRMEASAIKNDSSFWNKVRPIQLTVEEKVNYIKKDSLKKVWDSKEYKDSVDRVNNKFVFGDVLFGYSRANTYKNRYFSYSSPLSTYKFNAVEGSSLNMGLDYVQLDSARVKRLNLNGKIGYGFADKRFKIDASVKYRTSRVYLEQFSFGLGDSYRQLDENGVVISLPETFLSLYFKNNQKRLFRKRYARVDYQREVFNGVFVTTGFEYARRSSLTNNTEFSFFKKDELFKPNDDISFNSQLPFETNNNLEYSLDVRFRIGQKYATLPNSRSRSRSKWPDIWLHYKKGIALGDTDFDKISLQITKNRINANIYGYSSFNIEAGTFLNDNETTAVDWKHFLSNENRFTSMSRRLSGFRTMPHYTYSTTGNWAAGWYEHVFDGFLLDLVPGVNKLGLSTVVSANALFLEDGRRYNEMAVGINEIKLFGFTLFRFDVAWAYDNNGFVERRFVLGLSSVFDI